MYCPIGFHTGPGGNPTGIGDYFRALDGAGRPAVLKSVDAYGFCRELAALAQKSGVPHVIVFRLSGEGVELPDYHLPPEQAAHEHWQRILAKLPPEFAGDKEHVWLEVINEPDKGRADWLGHFMTALAELAIPDGYKICGPGWSSGEPEPEQWLEPGWIKYLVLCQYHPDQAAISIHEYSYEPDQLRAGFGFKIGRFRQLFDACDELGMARPAVLITEWGWAYNDLPDPNPALSQLADIAQMYAQHPQILGAAIWYLGSGFMGIAHKAQKLIGPLTDYAVSEHWQGNIPPRPNPAPKPWPISNGRGRPRVQYDRTYQVVHPSLSAAQAEAVFRAGLAQRRTTGFSFDDAAVGDLDNRTVIVFGCPAGEEANFRNFYATHYPGVKVAFEPAP